MNKILLLLDRRQNRRLLAEALAPRYEVISPASDEALQGEFDLGIVDGVALERLWTQVQARKQAARPAFLPFLLVASRQDVSQITRHLKTIDELIISPIEKVELQARVEVLLQTRRLSLESEAWFRTTLYSIGDAVIATDRRGVIRQMNAEAERLTGWREAEAQGRALDEVFHIVNQDTRAPVENPVQRILREGVAVSLANHTLLIARAGAEIPIADSGAPIYSENEPVGVVLVFRDQTTERAAQQATQEAREFAQAIVATIREPLLVLDAELRAVSANRAFYTTFQTAPEATLGQFVYDLGNRQWDIPDLRRLLHDILPHNTHFDDYKVTHAFERIGQRIMLLNARRIYREERKTQFILLAIEDITTREQQAAELQRLLAEAEQGRRALLAVIENQNRIEQERQRHLQELSAIYKAACILQHLYTPDQLAQELIVLIEDTLGYEYGAVLVLDEASGELIPFALSEQGRGRDFVPLDQAHVASHHITLGKGIVGWVAQTGQPVRLGHVQADPRYYPMREGICSELCVPLRAGDRTIGALNVETTKPDAYTESDQRVLETVASQIALAIQQAFFYDQIQRHSRELEQRVRERTIELEVANKELETFAYSVSHDLRAPLRALEGFAALLARYQEQLDEQGQHYLERIRAALQQMENLINALLDLSRVMRCAMVRRPVDLSALASQVAAELQAREPQRRIEFVIADGLTTQGDPHLLRIMLDNLLGNAVKFTGKCERAVIEFGMSAADRAAGRQQNVSSPVYFVRDNGVGFDMAYADKLFAPFQRMHSEREFPGTGIGLATVQRIVARHGGCVWAQAQVNSGATFYFTLA